jgi:hypothetical protein
VPDRVLGAALSGLRPLGPAPSIRPVPGSASGANVDRLVGLARELLQMFGAGWAAGTAESQIRSRVSEQNARQALERIHAATRPPYG